ncbi:unnamed protein product [Tilletia controversa]|nr:unnamed protein product [Tilletia controversa]
MNRSSRVHKSTKIPNVKLRPAPAASTSAAVERDNARRQTEREDNEHYRKIRRAAAADADRRAGGESALVVRDSLEPESYRSVGQEDHEDKDDEDAEAEFALPEVMPLAGINVCFSSIADEDDRLKLTRLATRLGARVESDLREDVNYLICEKVGSPKYQQALERGKFIVQPGWLEEVHRRYQDDLPFEWVKMYSAHRVKALQGCHILFTGYKKDKSLAIEKAQGLGARVSHEITGDNGVTHVVSGTNSNAESKLVETLASFWDGYDKGTLRTERMIRIVETVKPVWSEWLEDCERAGGESVVLSQSRRDRFSEPAAADQLGAPSSQQAGKRKASEAEIAAQAESHPSKVPRAASVDRRHNPFAKVVDRPVARSPFAMLDDIVPVRRRFGSPLNRSEHEEPESKKGIFFKCRFRIKLPEEAHIRSTRAYLEEQGATVLSASDIATKADYTVVPIFYPYGAESIEGHLVTKLFIERCVWEERVVRLTASFGLQPSPYAAPITGGTDLVVYLTGFRKDAIDQKQAETVIKEAGGRTLSALLRRECTHLLCSEQVASGAKGSDKVDVARAAGIHIVGMDFIQRLMDRGLIDPPCPRSRSMSAQGRSTSFGMSDSSILGPTQIETEPRLDGRKSNAESPLRQKAGSESPAKPEFPLKGVYLAWSSVVYPDKGFLSQAKDLGAVIVSLGDGMTTHLLHRGALTQGCAAGVVSPEVRIVDPDWLRACLATKSHAREDLYPVDLGRSAPLAESTPRVTAVRTAPMFEAAKQQSDALASNQPGSGDEASPPSLVVLKASSSGTTEASSDADNQAYVFALPDTCGETARVMAALNTGMETALGGHAPAAAAVPAGRRKLRPQRALGRTGSNGSATETKPAAQEDAARAGEAAEGASADRSYDAAWPGGISQVNLTSETPPISVRVSYEDDGKKERARLLAAMERDRKRKQREEADSHRDEDDEALSSTKEFPARSPMDGSRSTGKGASSSSSSKNRIQARKQPGSRH